MSNVSIMGIDISKRSFQLHGATAEGAPVLRRKLLRGKVLEFLASSQRLQDMNSNKVESFSDQSVRNTVQLPGRPRRVTVLGGSTSMLWVIWAPSAGRAVTDYDIRYYAGSTDPSNDADWIEPGEPGGHDHTGTATLVSIGGLEPAAAYRVQVRAVTDDHDAGPWSESAGGATLAPVGGEVGGQVSGSSLSMTFEEELDPGSRPSGEAFTVTATPAAGSPRTISGTGRARIAGRSVTVPMASAAAQCEAETRRDRVGVPEKLRPFSARARTFSGFPRLRPGSRYRAPRFASG